MIRSAYRLFLLYGLFQLAAATLFSTDLFDEPPPDPLRWAGPLLAGLSGFAMLACAFHIRHLGETFDATVPLHLFGKGSE